MRRTEWALATYPGTIRLLEAFSVGLQDRDWFRKDLGGEGRVHWADHTTVELDQAIGGAGVAVEAVDSSFS